MIDMDQVPWLRKQEIQKRANKVLIKAGRKLNMAMKPPIPVETIIERVYGLHLSTDNLSRRFAHLNLENQEILGATLAAKRQVIIDESLLGRDDQLGRYFFTCAHELAHWVLHRHLAEELKTNYGPGKEFADLEERLIVCRSASSRQRGEWQADYMAGCLLMPADHVREAYHRSISDKPKILLNQESSVCTGKGEPMWLEPVMAHAQYYAREVIEAGKFNVSRTAMSVRLQELGLLVNAVDNLWVQ